jgi:DNA helicase-2/ATP-dependent DNA helicase PcrA
MPFKPTSEQQRILSHDPTRHARVLAGPGTGKSTTMVALLDELYENHGPLRLRMLTFTRAATAELAEKISSHSKQAEHPSTIHSFAISILVRNPGTGGFPEPLRIGDNWECKNIVYPTLAKRLGVHLNLLKKLIQEMASNWESLRDDTAPDINADLRVRFRGAWNEHRKILGYTLLQELPYALHRALCNHDDLDGINFDLLIVDEYQDLNACDLAVLKLLSKKSGCRIIGTGDDDQSIYSWRKAAPEGIRRFLSDYNQAEDYSLSVTMRCGREIIGWANSVIQGDPDRPIHRLVLDPLPDSPNGEVALLKFGGERTEAKGIAQLVYGLIDKEGLQPKDILVLVRTDHNGTFSKYIREELDRIGVAYSDPSSIDVLLDENRRLLELLRLLVNREDSLAWASLLHLMKGVGTSCFQYVYDRAKERGVRFYDTLLADYRENFPDAPVSASKVKAAMDAIIPWIESNQIPDEQPEEGWGSWIIELAGKSELLPAPTDGFRGLLLELDGLSDERQELGRFLGQIEPLGKDLAQARSEGVRIMTMAGSKGLTVRATIIAGVEDQLVPRPECDLSEERRILYVAMTRAKEYLFCTWASRRRGPTARAGRSSLTRRLHSHFFDNGPVQSQNGETFIRNRF